MIGELPAQLNWSGLVGLESFSVFGQRLSFIAHSDCQAAITVIRAYSRGIKSIYGAMRPLPGGVIYSAHYLLVDPPSHMHLIDMCWAALTLTHNFVRSSSACPLVRRSSVRM